MTSSAPLLIRGYLKLALPHPPTGCRAVRLQQTGEMTLRPGTAPRRFTATQELETGRVAFCWRARFPVLGPLGLRVLDSYDGHTGTLQVRAVGLPLQRATGVELAQGEAFRYLAELPWVPHAMVANPELRWRELDARTVEVATLVAGERIAVRLCFDETGRIAQTIGERPRLEAGGRRPPYSVGRPLRPPR